MIGAPLSKVQLPSHSTGSAIGESSSFRRLSPLRTSAVSALRYDKLHLKRHRVSSNERAEARPSPIRARCQACFRGQPRRLCILQKQSLWYTGMRMAGQIEQAINILKRGGIVAFPTDTVYGLAASSVDDHAVARVYEAKRRPRHLALPLLLSHVSQIESVAQSVPEIARRLAEHFLPGALTLVLYKAPSVSTLVTGEGEKVALRVPNHPVPIALIQGLAAPITGTSANITGGPSLLTAEEVRQQMGDSVDLVIDGECPGGMDSTVLDLTGETLKILREGAISREKIERVCGTKVN